MAGDGARSLSEVGAPRRVLEVCDLAASYGGAAIFSGASFDVLAGEFWFLVGPNGSGKTTFLKCVLGVLRPSAGRIELAEDIRSGMRIGFVPQRCALKPTLPMAVADFVRLGLTGTGIRGRKAEENIAWALEETGLLERRCADYWSLSGGQRQRALVARGLVRRPELLVLDEPTNGLDIPAEDSFLDLVSRLNRERGLTVMFVTHAVGLTARFGTHVAIFGRGRVRAGPRSEILTRANLQEAYGMPLDIAPGDGLALPASGGREGGLP